MNRIVIIFLLVGVYLLGHYSDSLWAQAKLEGAKMRYSAAAMAENIR